MSTDRVLLSIHKEHAERILSGHKTLEIRKTAPSCHYPYTVYMYETKKDGGAGAVVGFFQCIARIKTNVFGVSPYELLAEKYRENIAAQSCLTVGDLVAYANGGYIYGLEIYSPIRYKHPRPLSDFGLTRAPQSWQYMK